MVYTINGSLYDSNYLAHHGILGMKWGQRRYQNKDGTLTSEGKKRYRKSEEQRTWNARHTPSKARKEEKAEERKARILKTGKASEVLKIKDQLTPDELNSAYQRLNTENNIYNISKNEPRPKTRFQKTDEFMEKVGKVANWVGNTERFYTNVNKLIKAVSGDPVPKPKK